MGNVRDGNCPVGIVRDGNCSGWELSGMGTVRDGNCPVGIVRDGNCPGWELSGNLRKVLKGVFNIPPPPPQS